MDDEELRMEERNNSEIYTCMGGCIEMGLKQTR
jgi:hypothetical protein